MTNKCKECGKPATKALHEDNGDLLLCDQCAFKTLLDYCQEVDALWEQSGGCWLKQGDEYVETPSYFKGIADVLRWINGEDLGLSLDYLRTLIFSLGGYDLIDEPEE